MTHINFLKKIIIGIIGNLETNFIHDIIMNKYNKDIIIFYNNKTIYLQSYTSSIKKMNEALIRSIRICIFYFISFYIRRAISTQTNSKKKSNRKKTHHIVNKRMFSADYQFFRLKY